MAKSKLLQAVGRNQPKVDILPAPLLLMRAPGTNDKLVAGHLAIDCSVSPRAVYTSLGDGNFDLGGNAEATNTVSGIFKIDTDGTLASADNTHVPTTLAAKTYIDASVVAGGVVATTATSGIGKLVSDVNAVARLASSGAQAYFVQPSNLTAVLSAPGPLGDTTQSTVDCTDIVADGLLDLDTTVAGHIKVTGAADFTLESTLGSLIFNAEEAAADAIQVQSAAGGLDLDVALGLDMVCSENAADAIILNASAGGIDITAAGAAGEDIDIVCTAGSVNITAGESAGNSIVISSTIGGIDITCAGAAAGEDIDISSTGSSVNISASENAADAITINASAGGIDITNTGTAGEDIDIASTGASVNVSSTEDAALAIYLHANGGTSETIRLRSDLGTGANSIEFISDAGGVLTQSGLDTANAIYLHADAGTSETVKIHSDQGTGVASIEVASDVGGVTISSGLASADAINLNASNAAGGIDCDCGSAGFIVDAASGPISLDGALASNFNVTGAGVDIDIGSASGRLILTSGEDAADSIYLHVDAGTSEKLRLHSDQGTGLDSVILESDVGGVTLTSTGLANAAAIDINSVAGGVTVDAALGISLDAAGASNFSTSGAGIDLALASASGRVIVTAGEDAADAIYLHADAGTSEKIRIHSDQGTAVDSVELESDVGGITLTSGLASADAVNLSASAGGVDIDGALQVNVASSQADPAAITLSASNAAGGITHTGKCIYTPDSVTSDNAGVAASVSTVLTQITTDGDSNEDNVTVADGVAGQLKIFSVIAAGNAADSIKITPANFSQGTKITFAADPTGKGCSMIFDGTNWNIFANNGGTIA